ncbi:CND2 protein, partial [Pitta sordida]|nr:CND2 protein [Pitta sordida]
LEQGDVVTMCAQLSTKSREYSYFSPHTMAMWAGPDHWRFRPRRKADGDSERESRKRNVRKQFELDLEKDVDFKDFFQKTKARTTMAQSTVVKRSVKRTTLPPDFDYDPHNLVQLFIKPDVQVTVTSEQEEPLEAGAEIGDYDYDNPNDTLNFCPALGDEDDDNDPGQPPAPSEGQEPPGIPSENPTGNPSGMECGELELLQEPPKVAKLEVPYARTATRMDMRLLKRVMWELLTQAQEHGPGRRQSVVVGQKMLSSILRGLHHRLPPAMAANLSVSLAFICLLHLANEKTLELEGLEDLSDVLVR